MSCGFSSGTFRFSSGPGFPSIGARCRNHPSTSDTWPILREKLGELDLEGIEPTAHPSPVFDRLEADEPRPGLDASALLDNAPDQASGQVRVPKVVADA